MQLDPTSPIKGYRQLNEQEVALMNEAKELADKVGAFIAKLHAHRDTARFDLSKDLPIVDQRWVSIGATQLQQGFMALTRGIAKPTSF
jgi:hypothetical protein